MIAPAAQGEDAGAAIAIWLFDVDRYGDDLARMESDHPRLSEMELLRAAAISDPLRRRRWFGAHVGLRLALAATSGLDVSRQPYDIASGGQPFLPPPGPAFSLSHSGPFALVAVAMPQFGPIGVDLEEVRPRRISAVRREKLEALAQQLARGAPLPGHDGASDESERRFIQAWCRIEACAKADGRGVGRLLSQAGIIGQGAHSPPARVEAKGGVDAPIQHDVAGRPDVVALDLQLGGAAAGYVAALAFPKGAEAATVSLTVWSASLMAA